MADAELPIRCPKSGTPKLIRQCWSCDVVLAHGGCGDAGVCALTRLRGQAQRSLFQQTDTANVKDAGDIPQGVC